MSANLRYTALRKRLGALLAGAVDVVPYERIVEELYRGLPHYTAIAVFSVTADGLVLQASHGVTEEQTQQMAEGLAAVAIETGKPLLVPDITRDSRARPLSAAISAELVVPVVCDDIPVLVIDVQSERYSILGRSDQELLTWVAREIKVPISRR